MEFLGQEGSPLGDPWEASCQEVGPSYLEEVPLGPWVEEDPHDQVGTELGLLQYWLWLQLQQLPQCLFLVGSSPAGTALQHLALVQQALQEPGAWAHPPGFLCQQPCRCLAPQQLQQVALGQCQYLWEEVLLLSWRPGSLLEATPDQGLASLLFLLVWSSLA